MTVQQNAQNSEWIKPENWAYAGRYPTREEVEARTKEMYVRRAATIAEIQPDYWKELRKV